MYQDNNEKKIKKEKKVNSPYNVYTTHVTSLIELKYNKIPNSQANNTSKEAQINKWEEGSISLVNKAKSTLE